MACAMRRSPLEHAWAACAAHVPRASTCTPRKGYDSTKGSGSPLSRNGAGMTLGGFTQRTADFSGPTPKRNRHRAPHALTASRARWSSSRDSATMATSSA